MMKSPGSDGALSVVEAGDPIAPALVLLHGISSGKVLVHEPGVVGPDGVVNHRPDGHHDVVRVMGGSLVADASPTESSNAATRSVGVANRTTGSSPDGGSTTRRSARAASRSIRGSLMGLPEAGRPVGWA